jgi:hypothetical protein
LAVACGVRGGVLIALGGFVTDESNRMDTAQGRHPHFGMTEDLTRPNSGKSGSLIFTEPGTSTRS